MANLDIAAKKCKKHKNKFLKGDLIMLVGKSHNAHATRRRKTSRLEARISAKDKELLKQAADLQGCSLTELVVRSALRESLKMDLIPLNQLTYN
jgi:predicted HicB family RNase H-like nuclease